MADAFLTRGAARDNPTKVMLPSGAMPVLTNLTQMLPASPVGEPSEDNVNRLSAYLHRLAGFSETEIDAVVKDHSYAKPWNWKPDNIYVKPIKKLFFSKTCNSSGEKLKAEEEIDVEDVEPEDKSAPYDLTRTRHHMDEFQRLANFVRPDDTADDWEEKIDKMLWLPVHHRIFSRVLRILSSERLARLAKSNCWTEPVFRRTSVDTAARRFRETLASTGWDLKTTQWLHSLLFDHLPRDYLAIYLDILQTLRLKIPQLVDRMIAVQPNISAKVGAISWETLSSLLKRSWDPFAACLNSNRPKKLPGNPILIVAPSNIGSTVPSRQHKWISQLGNLGMVVTVHMHLGMATSRMTMMSCMDQLVQATRAKIQDVRADCPGRPIILVGFNSGAALACQIAQMEHVTAVICLGFPFTTVEGKRGTPDDTLMDIRCPVMFVIGEKASLVRTDDLEDVREKMLVETSLVVVGTADDHLRVSTSKKISEGITQSMVDRCILDEIGDFVASILLQPHPLPPRAFSMSSYETKEKTLKKEPRKRKNSTSSSVDSETNISPNVKKSRPGTPVSMASSLTASRLVPFNPQTGVLSASASNQAPVANNGQAPVQKKRSRVTNSQRNHFSDNIISSKHITQQHPGLASNGGITLNIGSLASLAPIGPIRLAPTTSVNQSALTSVKTNLNCRSTVTLGPKMSKIMQTSSSQPTKIKTVVPTSAASSWTKGFSKVTAGKNVVGLSDKTSLEPKSFNILNAPVSQISPGVPSPASQTTSAVNSNACGALTALLQTGNSSQLISSTNSIAARGISAPSSSTGTNSILLTPCIAGSGLPAGSVTASASPKVTESNAGPGDRSERIEVSSTVARGPKRNSLETNLSLEKPVENSDNANKPMMQQPSASKTPTTILPLMGKFRTGPKYSNKVPKITMNSGSFQKNQRGKLQALQSVRMKKGANEADEDLGNILDIPIIFAKDGDNFNVNEREHVPPLRKVHCVNSTRVEAVELKPKRLSSAMKVVLISNKQQSEKNKTGLQVGQANARPGISSEVGQRSVAQVILHSSSENQSIGSNWNASGSMAMQTTNRQPTIKYTKIILAKRNTGMSSNCEKSQIILTKTASKGLARDQANEGRGTTHLPVKITACGVQEEREEKLEIEDAIKTNVIERKSMVEIPEIDLTSPTRSQRDEGTASSQGLPKGVGTQQKVCESELET